jgi:hypothetical protein
MTCRQAILSNRLRNGLPQVPNAEPFTHIRREVWAGARTTDFLGEKKVFLKDGFG